MVNSFRSEMAQKKAIFDLLTDDEITVGFPAVGAKGDPRIWCRGLAWCADEDHFPGRSRSNLPEFILKNRQKLVLRPNDDPRTRMLFAGRRPTMRVGRRLSRPRCEIHM